MSPKKLSPNNLTSAQLVLLSAAAQREDGAIELAPSRNGSAVDKVLGNLLRDGLIEEIQAGGPDSNNSKPVGERQSVAMRRKSLSLPKQRSMTLRFL